LSRDTKKMFFRYTMDSFTEIAFGESVESLSVETHPFSTSFDRAHQMLLDRYYDPLWVIKKKLNIGREKRIAQEIANLHKFANEVIAKRHQDEKAGKERNDLISQFLQFSKTTDEKMSDVELRDFILNFVIAGRDTTASALTWTTYELIKNPEVEKRVLDEMKAVFGADWKKEREGQLEKEDDYYYHRTNQLEYLDIVIMETLRLHAPVPLDDREAVADDVLPDGVKIPKGAVVYFNPTVHNRSSEVWGPDVLLFKPERWLDEDGKRKNVTAFTYPTFSGGLRMCLGKNLAILEVKLLLSLLLPRFHFALADKSYSPKTVFTIILTMTPPGLPLIVSRRQWSDGPLAQESTQRK